MVRVENEVSKGIEQKPSEECTVKQAIFAEARRIIEQEGDKTVVSEVNGKRLFLVINFQGNSLEFMRKKGESLSEEEIHLRTANGNVYRLSVSYGPEIDERYTGLSETVTANAGMYPVLAAILGDFAIVDGQIENYSDFFSEVTIERTEALQMIANAKDFQRPNVQGPTVTELKSMRSQPKTLEI